MFSYHWTVIFVAEKLVSVILQYFEFHMIDAQ